MGRVNWAQMAAFGLVALLVLLIGTSLMTPWAGQLGMMGGRGVTGPGMMGGWGILGWVGMLVIPIFVVTGLALGVLWLARQAAAPSGADSTGTAVPCPACGRLVQVGWRACPYCGNRLVGGPPEDTP